MQTFDNFDKGYLQWIETNPNGFVLNVPKRETSSSETVLHTATCSHIVRYSGWKLPIGKSKKVCSLNRQELVEWANKNTKKFRDCKRCKP